MYVTCRKPWYRSDILFQASWWEVRCDGSSVEQSHMYVGCWRSRIQKLTAFIPRLDRDVNSILCSSFTWRRVKLPNEFTDNFWHSQVNLVAQRWWNDLRLPSRIELPVLHQYSCSRPPNFIYSLVLTLSLRLQNACKILLCGVLTAKYSINIASQTQRRCIIMSWLGGGVSPFIYYM